MEVHIRANTTIPMPKNWFTWTNITDAKKLWVKLVPPTKVVVKEEKEKKKRSYDGDEEAGVTKLKLTRQEKKITLTKLPDETGGAEL